MNFAPDFLTAKAASVNAAVTDLLRACGWLNPALVYGLRGEERGVPLDLRPLANLPFVKRNPQTLRDVADFLSIEPDAFVRSFAKSRPDAGQWRRIVCARLRTLRPGWYVTWETTHGLTDALVTVAANPVRTCLRTTRYRRMADGQHIFGTIEAQDRAGGIDPLQIFAPIIN